MCLTMLTLERPSSRVHQRNTTRLSRLSWPQSIQCISLTFSHRRTQFTGLLLRLSIRFVRPRQLVLSQRRRPTQDVAGLFRMARPIARASTLLFANYGDEDQEYRTESGRWMVLSPWLLSDAELQ